MGSINVDPHRIIVPLKDWIAISSFVEQGKRSESSQNDYAGNSPARHSNAGICSSENGVTGREQVKIDDIMRSIRMAILLVDRLVRKDDDIDLSDVEGAAPLKAHDISVENFLVEMRVPREVPITDSLSNADDIMHECSFPQIKSVLEGAFDVKLVPALQNTVGFQVDEVLEHEIFRQLGILFYELFSEDEPSLPRSLSNQDHSVSLQQSVQCEGNLRNEGGPLSSDEVRDYNGTCKDLKKLDVAGPVDLLQQKSLPLSVCRLVIDLIECGIHEEGMFQSLKDVKSELTQILNEPDIFLNENNIGDMSMRFCSAKLFGRNDVLSTLIQAALMTPVLSESNVSTVVLIEGDPGAGKSTLVHAIKEPICNHGWQFLSCKFDRLTENQPLSTISSTFNEFFQRIVTILSELEDGIRIDDAVSQYVRRTASLVETHLSAPGIVFLSKLIPSFRSLFPDIFQRVVGDHEDSDSDGEQRVSVENDDSDFDDVQKETSHGSERHASFNSDDIGANNNDFVDDDSCDCLVSDSIKNRLHYLFQELTQAISSPDAAIMLFLDDLQWADKESLELITSLVVDVDQLDAHQRCISFVVSYRSNEKDKNQSLVDCIESIERSNATQVTHMQLGGMDIEGTNAMIADALKLPIRLTRPLSVAVHQKTLGNPLFVKVFLTMLFEEHAISYSFKKKRWLWDMNTIHQRSMDRELAMVLSEKLLNMSREVQETLTFVACFGMRVRRDVLSMASCDSEEASRILSCLKIAVKESILDEDDEYFSFPHDLIQQAAYERVHEKELRSYHFSIGLQILKNAIHTTRAEPLSQVSFIALEQIIMAKDMTVPDPKVRMSLALLFLRAGKHSIQVAAFPSALSYFERGLSFLGEDGWELNHELSLRLHESMCHACYLNALPDRVPAYTDMVISHADDFMDQVKCHHITMQTLASTGNFKKAFDKFLEVMKELGEELSPNVDPSVIFPGMYATKNDLSKYSTEDLMNVPKMTDKRKQWAMTFMDSIIPCVFVISPLFLPTIANRMITLSLRYGLTKESAFGLYAYCYCLGCMLQDIDEGYRWIKVTRLMLEKFNAAELCPKLKLVQYSFLIYMKEPLQSVTNVLFHCREEIMMVGDIEYAILSAHFHCQFAVLTGASLSNAEKECDSLSKEMVRLKQTQSILENASIHHMVLQLIGSDKDSFAIPGISYKDEDEVLDHLESSGNVVFANSIYTHRVVTACFFRRFEYAADMIEKYHSEVSKGSLVLSAVIYAFYEGLVAFRMARSRPNDEKKWLVKGESAIQRYKTWTTHSEWNFENKLLLLEAESLFCQGNYDSAEKKYISSIESARRHKFVHEQGLALDLFASMYKFRGDSNKEAECLEGAFGCYETWGAHGLLSHIRDE